MQYVSASTISVKYTIPVSEAANATQSQYHIEVQQGGAGNTKKIYPATAITAAVAPSTDFPGGTEGSVTFGSVALSGDGTYLVRVFYSSNSDLDTAGVSAQNVRSMSFIRVTPVTLVTM